MAFFFTNQSRLLWLGEIHGFVVPLFIIYEDDIKLHIIIYQAVKREVYICVYLYQMNQEKYF